MEQSIAFPGHALVCSSELQMVCLGGTGHTAARQKGPPQEGCFAAVLLHYGQIDMQGQGVPSGKAEGIHNGGDFVWGSDLEYQLPGAPLLRQLVKAHAESLAEEPWQQLSEVLALRNDLDLCVLKAIAKEQNAEAFRQGAAGILRIFPTDLCLGGCGKGLHGFPSFFYQTRTSGSS